MPKKKQSGANRSANIDPQAIGGSNSPILPDSLSLATSGYEIRVKDHLETYWNEWFEGWSITNLACGEVLLRCQRVDQSALHGALNKIRDLNLVLLSVTRISVKKSSPE
jgi:hypothetical protein